MRCLRLLLPILFALTTSLPAQSTPAPQHDPSPASRNSSVPVANICSSSKSASLSAKTRSATGLSSLPPGAQRDMLAALEQNDPAWMQQAELTAADGAGGDRFGRSVAVSGSTVVVGAWGHTVGSNYEQGAVYVFVESGGTWSQQAELTASDGGMDDQFGFSVAFSGSTITVGAPGHWVGSNPNQGAAYVFVENGGTWSQQQELTASDGVAYDEFGYPVAVDGGTIVVGATSHPYNGQSGPGAAYVFVQSGTTWNQQAELTASDGVAYDDFGDSVAINGSTIQVGAPGHPMSESSRGPGAAYVFVENGGTWSQQQELTASDGVAYDDFGLSVAVSGSTLVVGAPQHPASDLIYGPGAAYVFVENGGTWSQRQELTASDGVAADAFGGSVTVDGTTAVVGALLHPFSPPEKPGPGAAYVFVQSGKIWSQQAELTASDAVAGDEFGGSVAVIGGTIVAGAPEHRVGLNQQGAGYVYVPGPTTVTFSPNSVNFGNQAVNTTSKAQSVALTNLGTSTLDISSIAITLGPSFTTSSNTCGATLAVNKTCKVSVTFTPTQLDSETGSLSFADTAAPSPQMVWLKGTGIPQTKLTPARYTFPKTEVGFTSAAHNFTLKNNQPITLTGISYSTSTPFAVSASTCGATLNANKSCTISVTFSPTQTGEAYGPLTVSDSANNSPQKVNLSGTGD